MLILMSCVLQCSAQVAGRTPSEAIRAFVDPIQNAISYWTIGGKITADSYDPKKPGVLVLNRGVDVPLLGKTGMTFNISMNYVIVPTHESDPWKVSTTGWIYSLRGEFGLLEFHWHPISESHWHRPHVHVDKSKHHVPTGRVLIEDVLLAAADRGAECRNIEEWTQVVDTNFSNFALSATWGHTSPDPRR